MITAEDSDYLQQQWRSVQDNRPRVLGINWTSNLSSRLVNVARFGYVLMNRGSLQIDSNLPPTSYGINTGVTIVGGFPIIRVRGFNQLGGSPGWPYRFGPDSVYQFVDSVSYLRGNHALKFGGDIRRNYADPVQRGAAKGGINFNGATGFSWLYDTRRSSGWNPSFANDSVRQPGTTPAPVDVCRLGSG